MSDPALVHGKLCYIELPAVDVEQSATFYRDVFGWNIRTRGDGATSFDDTVGQVSGTWTTERSPASDSGPLIYIAVDDVVAASDAVKAAGGAIVSGADPDQVDVVAVFRDPGGNSLGLYQYKPENA